MRRDLILLRRILRIRAVALSLTALQKSAAISLRISESLRVIH
jgi:hypothetical protein